MIAERFTVQGQEVVYLHEEGDADGPLAYPEHVDKKGHVKFKYMMKPSFAYVNSDGRVWQFGRELGLLEKLRGT